MTKSLITSLLAALTLAVLPASATTYGDATLDFTDATNPGLDITSVDLNNDATTLSFTITTAGAPNAQTWYNYLVGISKPLLVGGGNANATGGWGTALQMSVGGMDYFIGAFPGFGGDSIKVWDGVSAWISTAGVASASATQVTFSVPLLSFGLSPGDTIQFDVWTQSSGNTVLDALSDTTPRGFNSVPFDTGANGRSYTVAVPEPTTCVLLGMGALVFIRRAFRRSA